MEWKTLRFWRKDAEIQCPFFYSISSIISSKIWFFLFNLSTASRSPSPHREEISLPVRGAAEGWGVVSALNSIPNHSNFSSIAFTCLFAKNSFKAMIVFSQIQSIWSISSSFVSNSSISDRFLAHFSCKNFSISCAVFFHILGIHKAFRLRFFWKRFHESFSEKSESESPIIYRYQPPNESNVVASKYPQLHHQLIEYP